MLPLFMLKDFLARASRGIWFTGSGDACCIAFVRYADVPEHSGRYSSAHEPLMSDFSAILGGEFDEGSGWAIQGNPAGETP
jgi:hypothetical protein